MVGKYNIPNKFLMQRDFYPDRKIYGYESS